MLNRISLFGAMLATVSSLTTPASASVVYTHDVGVWRMIGDVEPDASDNACIFQISLATAHVQINIFPKTGIPDHVTMTLADPKGTWRPRQTIVVRTLFLGDNVDVTPFYLVATANNNEKITFRDLPLDFLSNFGHANSITLFREDPKETFIDLTGTSELLKGLEDCKASLINPPGDTNVAIPANPVAQPAPSSDVVAARPAETPQPGPMTSLAQTSDDPGDTVRIIYNTADKEHSARLWSPRMKSLWIKQDSIESGVGALDFDYKSDSQDPGVRDLKIAVISSRDADAEVRVTFNEYGSSFEMRYDLVKYNGSWVIDEVRKVKGPGDLWVLSEILKQNK